MDVRTQARLGSESMLRQLLKSNSAQITPYPCQDSHSIRFQIPVGYDAGGNLLWGADHNEDYEIRFAVDANRQLVRQVFDDNDNPFGPQKVIAKNIDDVQFNLPANSDLLEIRLTASHTNNPRNLVISHTHTSSKTLRN